MSSTGNLTVSSTSFTFKSKTYSKRDIKEIKYFKKGSFNRIWEGSLQIIWFPLILPIIPATRNLFSDKIKVRLITRQMDSNGKNETKALWMTKEEVELLQGNF